MERSNSTGKEPVLQPHLNNEGNSLEDSNVHVLAEKRKWFDRGVKEAMLVKVEKPSLSRGGGFQ